MAEGDAVGMEMQTARAGTAVEKGIVGMSGWAGAAVEEVADDRAAQA